MTYPKNRNRRPFEDRFWEKVDKRGPDECWEWTASTNSKGYGRLSSGRGVYLKAHRTAFVLSCGPIPEDLNVLHTCDNPPCCNPKHLFLGTFKDNTHDMIRKGRGSPPPHTYGELHHNAKFDAATARKIIEDERTLKAIAADHGISWMTVFRLKHGQTWAQLVDRSVP